MSRTQKRSKNITAFREFRKDSSMCLWLINKNPLLESGVLGGMILLFMVFAITSWDEVNHHKN
jgi:hypothetical protein